MTPGTIRTGGVCTFVMLGLPVLAIIFALLASVIGVVAGALGAICALVAFGLFFFVLFAIKGALNANGFYGANAPILIIVFAIIALIVVSIAAAVFIGVAGAKMNPAEVFSAFGVWGIVIGLIALALYAVWLVLGLQLVKFAAIGGGLWKAAGVLCIIFAAIALFTIVLGIIGVIVGSSGAQALGSVAGAITFFNLLVLLVFWIVIGIALISTAGNLERQVA